MTHIPSHLVPLELWIISGPHFPPDLYDTCSVSSCSLGTLDHLWTSLPSGLVWHMFSLILFLGNSGSSLERDLLQMKLLYWINFVVCFSFIRWFQFSLINLILGFMRFNCAIFLAILWHSLDPSLLIQHATFNKLTRILIFHLQQLVGCKMFLWLVHCALHLRVL